MFQGERLEFLIPFAPATELALAYSRNCALASEQ